MSMICNWHANDPASRLRLAAIAVVAAVLIASVALSFWVAAAVDVALIASQVIGLSRRQAYVADWYSQRRDQYDVRTDVRKRWYGTRTVSVWLDKDAEAQPAQQ